MNKLSIFVAAAIIAGFYFSDDVKRLYRNHQIDQKFEQKTANKIAMAAADSGQMPADDPTILNAVWEDEHGLMHGGGIFNNDIAPAELAAAMAKMKADTSKPIKVVWEMLKDVKFKKKYNKDYDQYFDYPVFGAKLRAIEGKKISVSGYIIPLDVGMYALSKNPYAACFFCGGAGPETIMALVFSKSPRRYKTDDFITLEGIFKLNDANVDQFMYQLVSAEEEM